MTNLPKSASSSPATKLAEELFDFVVARYKVLTIGNQRDLEVEELAKRIRGSASPSEADEISNIKACNESLAKLIDQVWEALEPTGEYEGDMNLVEFAKSVRIGKESAEWSRDGLLFKAASSSASAVPPPLDEILETLKFAKEVIHDQAERFHKGCRCQLCESLPESLQRAIELLEGSKVAVPQPSAGQLDDKCPKCKRPKKLHIPDAGKLACPVQSMDESVPIQYWEPRAGQTEGKL